MKYRINHINDCVLDKLKHYNLDFIKDLVTNEGKHVSFDMKSTKLGVIFNLYSDKNCIWNNNKRWVEIRLPLDTFNVIFIKQQNHLPDKLFLL